ncbi:MAG: hypothetical protein A2Y75_05165 [Candidatus Solincola sediminis]|uniref:Uncharacterized protein n=1 Tax=Candidatus Solincola sediminis TaxID=1797199 RepID=A0A1F2WG42_9ACTN|nr:MAG: hypothetical protein A2Y75_05165 [Candidatus Solincola sediminis]
MSTGLCEWSLDAFNYNNYMPPTITNANGEVKVVKTLHVPIAVYADIEELADARNVKVMPLINELILDGLANFRNSNLTSQR